jgi:hypothetical protein
MKKTAASVLVTITAGYLIFSLSSASAPKPEQASPAVRGMAKYLAGMSPAAVRTLAGASPALAPARARVITDTAEVAANAAQAAMTIVEETEHAIVDHYPATETGALLRRYVVLQLSDVNGSADSDLNRETLVSGLMVDPVSAVSDMQSALAAIPADSEGERDALLSLASRLGADGRTRVATESILVTEMNRHSNLDSEANEARLVRLLDSYSALETDPAKRAVFFQAGIRAQNDPRLRDALQSKLDSLNHLELSRSPGQDPTPGA